MAKFKSLLLGARVVSAGRSRKCYHSPDHRLEKGDVLIELKDGRAWKGYCPQCAEQMCYAAEERIRALRAELAKVKV